jgi:CubicO group peptidase (beta-lactamase class C family)
VRDGPAASDRLVELLDRQIISAAITGAAVGVANHDTTLIEVYAGSAAPGLASGPRVLWPVASISKLFAAAMVMRLVELGEISLSTLVAGILPELAGEGRDEIRVRHLLTHTAGLRYESPEMEARLVSQTPLEDLVAEACRAPLTFRPGTQFAYSDDGYLLAGHLAAVVAGQPYPDLVQTLVCEPMGLADTFVVPPADAQDRIAVVAGSLSEGTSGAMYNSAYARALGHPAFGVVSTLPDLLRFAAHFAPGGPRIHSEATIRAMTISQTGGVPGEPPLQIGYRPDVRTPWGLGFELQTEALPGLFSDLVSPPTFGHGGASGCQLLVDPEADLRIVILTNAHLRLGLEAWLARLHAMTNVAVAEGQRVAGSGA